MQKNVIENVDYMRYARLLWKRKAIVMIPLVVFPVLGALYAMRLPDSYKSSTLILVTPQKVPAKFITSSVTTDIEERLGTISQQIFSRTRLDQVIQEFGLFADKRDTMAPEEIIGSMRNSITLKVSRKDAFELSYVSQDPRMAMQVTNKLAGLFIEENLKVREQQAIGTSLFLGDEIERYREKVREQEEAILAFKRKYMNELPEQQASNQSRLGQLQNQLQINSQNINAAGTRKVALQQQLMELERRVLEQPTGSSGGGPELSISRQLELLFAGDGATTGATMVDDAALRALEQGIAERTQAVEDLLLRYTERHPDVGRLRGEIAQLEQKAATERERIEAERAARDAQAPVVAEPVPEVVPPPVPESKPEPQYPPAFYTLKADLAETEAEIARLTARNRELQAAAEEYQTRIASAPTRQLELQQLSEGYSNLKSVMESLINKKLEADLSENLERKQKGEQFKILDPANLPQKPFSPKRLVYVAGGAFLGLGLGAGLVLLFDLLIPGVRNRDDLAAVVGAPVLGEIPTIETDADRRRQRLVRLGISGALGAGALVILLVVHLSLMPLPQAAQSLVEKARTTHWTTIR